MATAERSTTRRPHPVEPWVSAHPPRAPRRCLTKTDSRKLTANEGAQQRSIRSVASGSRLGSAATVSDARGRRRSTAEKDKVAVAVATPDAFPSTRYDAMLLREDPKNLTWLNGCGEDDDNGEDGNCGAGLVDGEKKRKIEVKRGCSLLNDSSRYLYVRTDVYSVGTRASRRLEKARRRFEIHSVWTKPTF